MQTTKPNTAPAVYVVTRAIFIDGAPVAVGAHITLPPPLGRELETAGKVALLPAAEQAAPAQKQNRKLKEA
jgi:hypothetical protein